VAGTTSTLRDGRPDGGPRGQTWSKISATLAVAAANVS
jgi:hypothetical protein